MRFKEYYKDRKVVASYDLQRGGWKSKITRKLELSFIDSLVETDKKQKILEIGVGTGFIAKLLVEKGNFTGLDISDEMLGRAKVLLGEVALIKGDILNLSLNKKFDKAVSVRVISHFDKKDAITALNNINKVLVDGGELVFNLENVSYIRRAVRKITNWGSTYTFQYSKDDINELLKRTRFKQEKILYLDHMFLLPLYVLNKVILGRLSSFLFSLELKLKNTRFMSNNSFIKCKKYSS